MQTESKRNRKEDRACIGAVSTTHWVGSAAYYLKYGDKGKLIWTQINLKLKVGCRKKIIFLKGCQRKKYKKMAEETKIYL